MTISSSSARAEMDSFRVGIVNADIAARDSQGNLVYYPTNGRLFQALLERLPNARLLANVIPVQQPGMTHVVHCPAQDVWEMPSMHTTAQAQFKFRAVRRALHEFAATVDVLYIRMPFQIPRALIGLPKPKLLHINNDVVEFVRASHDYRGIKRFLARWYAQHSENTMRRIGAEPDTRTVAHGRPYWEKLGCPAGRFVVSSGLYESEMRPKTDFRLHNPPRLLFVGFLRPEKGVPTLLEAFEKVRSRRPLKLTLAGGTDRISQTEAIVSSHIARSSYAQDIERIGPVEFGEPLFDLYRNHDIYVLSSLAEGTPRTLVEARAFGCAVVATNVGGVPSSIEDGKDGLLIPPGDADAMAAAIERLLDDEGLRLRLIEEGIRRTRTLTVEHFADELVEELRLLAAGRTANRGKV